MLCLMNNIIFMLNFLLFWGISLELEIRYKVTLFKWFVNFTINIFPAIIYQ